jgi:hypothetical protein
MVKKAGASGAREGAQVPTCRHCGKRAWTDWRPQFQKYLCDLCCREGATHGAFLDRRERKSN